MSHGPNLRLERHPQYVYHRRSDSHRRLKRRVARERDDLARADIVLGSRRLTSIFHRAESMYNAEKRGKRQVLVRPVSKVVIKFLQVMQKHGK